MDHVRGPLARGLRRAPGRRRGVAASPVLARDAGRGLGRRARVRRGGGCEARLAAQLHAGPARGRRGRGVVGPVRRRGPPRAVFLEQELHLDRRRPGDRRGEDDDRRPGPGGLPEDAPGDPSANLKAMRLRDLLRMSAGHQAEPKVGGRRPLGQEFPGAPGAVQAGDALPVQHAGHLHGLGDGPEGDRAVGPRLPRAPPLRAPGDRGSGLGRQLPGDQPGRIRPEPEDRGHRQVRPVAVAERQVAGQAARPRRVGRGRPPPARPPTAATPRATGSRGTATSSGGAGTAPTGATGPSVSIAWSSPSRTP